MFGFLLNVPGDIGSFLVDGFRRDNLPALAGIAAATAGLVAVDQSLVNGAQRAGRATHVASADETRKVPGLSLPYPADVGAALYYIGDGMVPATIALGLFAYGLGASDVRALQTTSQLVEGTLSVGIVVQAVKHAAGRESPGQATQAGGAWRPAPNLRDYHKNVPAFDAFPSGHMATAMVTLTVLAENYPEYWLIRPVGYGLMTLLGLQMMNNGAHWASDYPVAIAVGYGLGKRAVAHGRRLVRADARTRTRAGPRVVTNATSPSFRSRSSAAGGWRSAAASDSGPRTRWPREGASSSESGPRSRDVTGSVTVRARRSPATG